MVFKRLRSVRVLLRRLLRSEDLVLLPILLLAVSIRLYLFYSVPHITKSDETLYGHMAYYALSGSGFGFWEERSYFYPMILLVVIVFSQPQLTHVWDPRLLTVTRSFNLAMNLCCLTVTYLLGKSIAGRRVGVVAVFLLSISWLDAFWSYRAVSEVPSTLFLLLSLLFLTRGIPLRSKRHFFIAGLFLGFSFMARFQSLLFFLPLISISEKRMVVYTLFGLMLAVLMQGIVDLISWGSFLSSPWNFFVLNILTGGSARWGVRPATYYLERLPTILGFVAMILALLSVVKFDIPTRLLWMDVITYLVVFSLIPHKERRFLFPILPLLYLLAALGFTLFERRLENKYHRVFLWLFLLFPEIYLSYDIISAIVAHEFLVP